jgi:hypothetical protein
MDLIHRVSPTKFPFLLLKEDDTYILTSITSIPKTSGSGTNFSQQDIFGL